MTDLSRDVVEIVGITAPPLYTGGGRVYGVAKIVVPRGEVVALVVVDDEGAWRAIYWDRERRLMLAPLVANHGGVPDTLR